MTAQEIYQIVLKSKLVPKDRLGAALSKSESIGKPFEDVLVADGLISPEFLAREIAKSLKIPFVDLSKAKITDEAKSILTSDQSARHQALVFDIKKKQVFVATLQYPNPEVEKILKEKGFVKVSFLYPDKQEFSKALGELGDLGKLGEGALEDLKGKSAVEILEALLKKASSLKASDIHLEKAEDEVLARFRVDGMLRDVSHIKAELHPELISRIKVLSNLRIDEKLRPQDGHFVFKTPGETLDLRVSILPSNYGESVVLRLLASGARPMDLPALGISGENLKKVQAHLKDSHGMILATGPTGSGKTTTLYSLLNLIDLPEVKICTIEDPVEYYLPRVVQVPVNRQAGLTFASGLRSLLRHDPDIMMVGEIRDPETADLAINAALTGHLVFSTLHTNDSLGFRDRLLDLAAPPFLIASTVNLVIAQRLVRRVCKKCTQSTKPSEEVLGLAEKLSGRKLKGKRFFKGSGCAACGETGFSGRLGIFEVVEVSKELRALIMAGRSEVELEKLLRKQGFVNMIEDGMDKATAGLTTLEEVLRVAGKA